MSISEREEYLFELYAAGFHPTFKSTAKKIFMHGFKSGVNEDIVLDDTFMLWLSTAYDDLKEKYWKKKIEYQNLHLLVQEKQKNIEQLQKENKELRQKFYDLASKYDILNHKDINLDDLIL